MSSERAFGLLKACWRRVLKGLDNQTENISEVIISCLALHNFCQHENLTKTEFLMTLSGKNVWQETEETN